jgi:uncharacterized protein YxeA
MKKCIFILTICVLSASAASASDLYYMDNSGSSDCYMQIGDNTYQSMNTSTSYTVRDNDIYGSDGSYYRQNNNMIYDMQSGSTYYNNNGYIQEF